MYSTCNSGQTGGGLPGGGGAQLGGDCHGHGSRGGQVQAKLLWGRRKSWLEKDIKTYQHYFLEY